jgi:heme exporter protein B
MSSSLLGTALAVAAKDIKIEWRTKTAFASSLVFAVLVLAVFYFSRDSTVVSELDIAPAALWVTFTFAAMLGLNRAFLLEQENRALDGILLTPVPRTGIFVGKLLGNLAFVVVVELVSLPMFAVFFNVPILHALPALAVVTAMATLAFVTVGTLLSAMVVRTRFAELMLPILLLPFLVPPIIGAVQITAGILAGRPLSEYGGWLKLLGSFDIAFVAACLLLFESTVEE